MNVKRPLTIILLVFVAASVVSMVLNEIRRQPANATAWTCADVRGRPGPEADRLLLARQDPMRHMQRHRAAAPRRRSRKVLVPNCSPAAWNGAVVNYEEPGNEHYATDFKLAAPCVVLASVRDGHQVAWKSLLEVWELAGNKPAFRGFVQKNLREQLDLGSPTLNTFAATAKSVPADTPAPRVAAKAKLPRLLDLGAGKCIPCKMMASILERLREEYQGRLEVVFIDVWENSAPAEKYGVSTIPTQIFFDAGGKERFRHEGFFSKEEILARWKELGVDL